MIITLQRSFLMLLLSVTLSACGFSLRGSEVLSSSFDTLQLNLADPSSEFSRLVQRSLENADVEIKRCIDGTDLKF